MKPYVEFIGTLQNSGFWLVKVRSLFKRARVKETSRLLVSPVQSLHGSFEQSGSTEREPPQKVPSWNANYYGACLAEVRLVEARFGNGIKKAAAGSV